MPFNIEKLKRVADSNTEKTDNKVNSFIRDFESGINDSEFESWLQKQLEFTSKTGQMYFYIGVKYIPKDDGIGYSEFCITDKKIAINTPIKLALPHRICRGREHDGKYPKETLLFDKYMEAMYECWNILVQKLKNLGLTTESCPKFDIDYEDKFNMIVIQFIEE